MNGNFKSKTKSKTKKSQQDKKNTETIQKIQNLSFPSRLTDLYRSGCRKIVRARGMENTKKTRPSKHSRTPVMLKEKCLAKH